MHGAFNVHNWKGKATLFLKLFMYAKETASSLFLQRGACRLAPEKKKIRQRVFRLGYQTRPCTPILRFSHRQIRSIPRFGG